jgi:hypothetical protein
MHDEREHDVEIADSVRGYKCDHCEHLHLVLLDLDDEPIATAVLTIEMLQNMLRIVQGAPQ